MRAARRTPLPSAPPQLRRPGSRRLRARGNALAPRAPPLALAGVPLGHLPKQDEAGDEQHRHAEDAVAA